MKIFGHSIEVAILGQRYCQVLSPPYTCSPHILQTSYMQVNSINNRQFNFTHSVKGKSSTLNCDRCQPLLILMTALWGSSSQQRVNVIIIYYSEFCMYCRPMMVIISLSLLKYQNIDMMKNLAHIVDQYGSTNQARTDKIPILDHTVWKG